MRTWMRRVRGAIGMGLTWGGVGFLVGMVLEVVHNVWPNPVGAAVDIWPAALAYPGLLGGVAFSVVLGVAGRRRRFDELSLPRVAAWGAVGGAVVGLIPAIMVLLGLATSALPIAQITAALVASCAVGGAIAASGTLAVARRAGADGTLIRGGTDPDVERDVAPDDPHLRRRTYPGPPSSPGS